MRPLRLLLSLSTSLLAVILLLYVVLETSQNEELERISAASSHGGFKAWFSFTSPGSLFPPSAIISLTDDNSTFFLARPAAFGPALPADGLSGSLWIGSGFGDDTMAKGGELGCSDVPGWGGGSDGLLGVSQPSTSTTSNSKGSTLGKDVSPKERLSATTKEATSDEHVLDDGTDDHLQPIIPNSHTTTEANHADIQSIQESAEIAGKVVLLKRGGCGFRAKVQWAQSRGGVAVIVGDDVRGGALIRMYARDDTSNITIPSLFTSHTTAHLLSSLLPVDAIIPKISPHSKSGSKQGDSGKDENTPGQIQDGKGRPTPTQEVPKTLHTSSHEKQASSASSKADEETRTGWMHSLLSAIGFGGDDVSPKAGSRRLPTSGDLNWMQVGDWDDDQKPIRTKSALPTPTSTQASDGFVIGEQDWRDPDLIPIPSSTNGELKAAIATPVIKNSDSNALPGSGEYTSTKATEGKTWWSRMFSSKKEMPLPVSSKHAQGRSVVSLTGADFKEVETSSHPSRSHEGLWVTLTPANVSSSPFFDTLLVLVVSPLVTLAVVYALLLLRSRIRRRRWRAPKSVVERLPVRTYQTISESSAAATPIAASPTTPLLQHTPSQPRSPVSRSRSTSESEAPATATSVEHRTRDREEEKRESGLAAWRRRYGGRQRECVVCLEEYVNGVSQVMSLPCGHEFHAECM
jgi:hypothetical protein